MNVLVVEDEPNLAEALVSLLTGDGYRVDTAPDGPAGEEMAMRGNYEVILLDILLPGKDGLHVLRTLRDAGKTTPVLLLTALSQVPDKVAGLDAGADDYLTKPFSSGELLARVRALIRRQGHYTGDSLSYDELQLDRDSGRLSYRQTGIQLGRKECQIMELFLQNEGQVLSKERFMEKVWGYESDAEYNAIEVYISFLRKKLAAIGARVRIRVIRGVGYALEKETATKGNEND